MRPAPSPSELELAPGPSVTPAPPTVPSRRSDRRRRSLRLRQNSVETAIGPTTCGLVGNQEISCFPLTSTRYNQHDWARFTWNNNLPNFTNTDKKLVDVYLFHGDSDQLAESWLQVPNQQGTLPSQVNDSWFGDRGLNWMGQKREFPMYFVVLQSGSDPAISARAAAQATFTVTQTTVLDSVASSSRASESSASSASAASASSASAASASSAAASLSSEQAGGASNANGTNGSDGTNGSSSMTRGPSGGLQPGGSGGSSFPRWAIAVVSVLGALALIFFIIFLFLFLRHMKERKRRRELERRGSLGSETPMIPNDVEAPASASAASPLMTAAAAGAAGPSVVGAARGRTRTSSLASPDRASTTSGDALFSGADAAIMADAFRSALRKPDFADRPVEEGESPGSDPNPNDHGLMDRELAEEGRDLRSVSSSRGVHVETQSELSNEDDGTTVQNHGARP